MTYRLMILTGGSEVMSLSSLNNEFVPVGTKIIAKAVKVMKLYSFVIERGQVCHVCVYYHHNYHALFIYGLVSFIVHLLSATVLSSIISS
jgi:hypothetical protein